MMYDGMHEATPEEVARRMEGHPLTLADVGGTWAGVVTAMRLRGASILLPDPPREADLHEHDGSVTRWIEVSNDEAVHRVSIRALNDVGYVVIKRMDGPPGEHGFARITRANLKPKES